MGNPDKKQLTLEDELEFAEKERTKKELEKEKEKAARYFDYFKEIRNNKIAKRVKRRKLKGYAFLFLGILVILQFILVFTFIGAEWNYVSAFLEWLDDQSDLRQKIFIPLLGVVIAICQWFLVKGFYIRVLDRKAENKFIKEEHEKFKMPGELRE